MNKVVFAHEEEVKNWIKEAIEEQFKKMVPPSFSNSIDEPFMTRKEVAKMLNISLVTLTAWTNRDFPHLRQDGRMYFLRSEIITFMKNKSIRTIQE